MASRASCISSDVCVNIYLGCSEDDRLTHHPGALPTGPPMSARQIPLIGATLLVLGCARAAFAAWPAEGVSLCQFGICDANLVLLCSDTQVGAYAVWDDFRNGNVDIYAQRVTASGEIAPGWPANGVPVCVAPKDQGRTLWSVVPDGLGGVLIDWWDGRNVAAGVTGYDIYAQRL